MTDALAVQVAIDTNQVVIENRVCLFKGTYAFLSNFYISPFTYSGREWKTVEHAYQSYKTTDYNQQEVIRKLKTPNEAKTYGRYVELRSDWETIKVDLMHAMCLLKFQQNPELAQELKGTGKMILIEGNTWKDQFWGICDGKGENMLGKILMNIRDNYL